MITEINGKTIERMSDVAPFIHNSGETGEPLNLVLLRDGKHIRTKLTPQKRQWRIVLSHWFIYS